MRKVLNWNYHLKLVNLESLFGSIDRPRLTLLPFLLKNWKRPILYQLKVNVMNQTEIAIDFVKISWSLLLLFHFTASPLTNAICSWNIQEIHEEFTNHSTIRSIWVDPIRIGSVKFCLILCEFTWIHSKFCEFLSKI